MALIDEVAGVTWQIWGLVVWAALSIWASVLAWRHTKWVRAALRSAEAELEETRRDLKGVE